LTAPISPPLRSLLSRTASVYPGVCKGLRCVDDVSASAALRVIRVAAERAAGIDAYIAALGSRFLLLRYPASQLNRHLDCTPQECCNAV